MRIRDRWSIATGLLAAVAIVSAPALIPLDLWALDRVQALGPSAAMAVGRSLEVSAQLALAIVLGGLLVREASLRTLGAASGVIVGGALFGELLATAIERLSPRSLPDMLGGDSLPSGHVMTTAIIALVAWSLVRTAAWRAPIRYGVGALLVGAVTAQAVGRVLVGSHWASDLVPSFLLAVTWILGARALFYSRAIGPRRALAGLTALYVIFYVLPGLRIHVASAMDRPRTTLAAYEVGEQTAVRDDSLTWARPRLPEPARALSPNALVVSTTLWCFGASPTSVEAVIEASCLPECPGCTTSVRFVLNGWHSREIELRCNRRWYRVRPPRGVLRLGENRVAVAMAPHAPSTPVAVLSLALVIDTQEWAAARAS